MFGKVVSQRQQVVVLPEIVGCFIPKTAVGHFITLRGVCAIATYDHPFIKGIETSQSQVVHVFIITDARAGAISAIHDTQVIGSCGNAIPSLSRLLEVADVLVANLKVVAYPSQTSIITAGTSTSAMNKSVGTCLMISTVKNQMVPQQSCRELSPEVHCIVGSIGCRQFQTGRSEGSGCCQCHRSAESPIAIGGRSYATLNLDTDQKRPIGIHICPEPTL